MAIELSDDEGDGIQSPNAEIEVHEAPPQFRTVAQGPLGAISIVKNRQILEEQLQDLNDLLREVGTEQGQQRAELHAMLKKLGSKEEVRRFLRKSTKKVEADRAQLDKWMKEFSNIADVDSDKVFTLRDKLPPNSGLAWIRLFAYYTPDDISLEDLPDGYMELVRDDMRLLAKMPAPSQDASKLGEDLKSAMRVTQELERVVTRQDQTTQDFQSRLGTESSEAADIQAKLDGVSKEYDETSEELRAQQRELQHSLNGYKRRLKNPNKYYDRQTMSLFNLQEEKDTLAQEFLAMEEELRDKNARIEQLDERVEKLVQVEQDCDSALATLQETIHSLQHKSIKSRKDAQREIDRINTQARYPHGRLKQRINKQNNEILSLKGENDRIEVVLNYYSR
ncbi:hypothetical protein SLS53_001530 [Cytospora paraplurivora]|uniref:Uncharacterized protein n=1 Tax=Cytospora paraplurivora TaxID=2898453 RepID=A0AAN9UGF4_9PEZI